MGEGEQGGEGSGTGHWPVDGALRTPVEQGQRHRGEWGVEGTYVGVLLVTKRD